MANDSLLAALVGGNESAAANPFLLQAPDLQTGQQLIQAGMSTAPAYPAQGWARLAQALAGTVMRHEGLSDLAKTYASTAADMATQIRKVDPNNVVVGMLESKNLPTVIEGVQMAQKIGVGLGLPRSVAPGAVEMTGTGGNTNPRSDAGIKLQEANRLRAAGQPAAADAIEREAGKGTFVGETGVQFPNVITPNVVRTVPYGPPKVEPAPPPPPAAVMPPKNPNFATATPVPKVQDRVPPPGGPANAPTQVAQAPGAGEVATFADRMAAVKGQQEAAKTFAEEGAKAEMVPIAEAMKEAKTAPQAINSLNIIEDTARRYGDKIITGPNADQLLKLKQAVSGLTGIPLDESLQAAELIKKMNANLASASLPAFTQRGTQFDLKTFMENNPGLNNSTKGTLFLADILKQTHRQNMELGRMASDPANRQNWGEVVKAYYEKHPLVNPMTGHELGVVHDTKDQKQSAQPAQAAPVQKLPHTLEEINAEMKRRGLQ